MWTVRRPFDGKGIKSAKELSVYFKNKYIDNVYVSDLKRTRQTYEKLFPYDIPTIYTKTLRERSLGVLKVKIKKKFVKTNGSKNISVILIINTLDIAFRKSTTRRKLSRCL